MPESSKTTYDKGEVMTEYMKASKKVRITKLDYSDEEHEGGMDQFGFNIGDVLDVIYDYGIGYECLDHRNGDTILVSINECEVI